MSIELAPADGVSPVEICTFREVSKDDLIAAMTDDSLPLFTPDRTAAARIQIGEGAASETPVTIMDVFQNTAKKYASKPALHQKVLTEVCR
jgi:hypothetical protein